MDHTQFIASPSVNKLGLAGIKLSAESLEGIANCQFIDELDLSNTELNAASMAALLKSISQRKFKLHLRKSVVDASFLFQLFKDRPELTIDITDSETLEFEDGYFALSEAMARAGVSVDANRIIKSQELNEFFWTDVPQYIPSRYLSNYTRKDPPSKFSNGRFAAPPPKKQQVSGRIQHLPFKIENSPR